MNHKKSQRKNKKNAPVRRTHEETKGTHPKGDGSANPDGDTRQSGGLKDLMLKNDASIMQRRNYELAEELCTQRKGALTFDDVLQDLLEAERILDAG